MIQAKYLTKYPIPKGLFLMLLILLLPLNCYLFQPDREPIFSDISVSAAHQMIADNRNNPDFIIIDVRTPAEYAGGHLEKALNIDYKAADFQDRLQQLDKTKHYLVYCQGGIRSSQALEIMRSLNFQEVYNMLGGLQAWQEQGYPVHTNEGTQTE